MNDASLLFKQEWFKVVDHVPTDGQTFYSWESTIESTTESTTELNISVCKLTGVETKKTDGIIYVIDTVFVRLK